MKSAATMKGLPHDEGMEIAFRKALDAYELESQPFTIYMFRPKLDQAFTLSGGRVANSDREVIYHDNGWSPYVEDVKVIEVPGDHDSMVLEPNVRVLATQLRDVIDTAESGTIRESRMTG